MGEKDVDCLGCRITGTVFGLGTSAYLMYEVQALPMKTKSHKLTLGVLAACIFGSMGIYRAITPATKVRTETV
ncbi:hypothetical protein BC833DRAFT_141277 [Globomyces pollinis-pini]|nr:hypothetical protein BC833DRAFT_141277 [Globomyces pollinis-pini]